MIYIEPILIISQIYTIKHLLTPRPWGLRWSFPGSPAEAPGRIWQGCSLVRPRSQVRLSKTYVLLKEHWIISKKLGYGGTRAQDGWLQPLLLFFFVGNDQLCGSIASIKPKLIKPDYESPRPDPQKKCSNLPNRSSPSKERVSKQHLIRKKSSFFSQIPRFPPMISPWNPHHFPIPWNPMDITSTVISTGFCTSRSWTFPGIWGARGWAIPSHMGHTSGTGNARNGNCFTIWTLLIVSDSTVWNLNLIMSVEAVIHIAKPVLWHCRSTCCGWPIQLHDPSPSAAGEMKTSSKRGDGQFPTFSGFSHGNFHEDFPLPQRLEVALNMGLCNHELGHQFNAIVMGWMTFSTIQFLRVPYFGRIPVSKTSGYNLETKFETQSWSTLEARNRRVIQVEPGKYCLSK